jgi:hypothetical protein
MSEIKEKVENELKTVKTLCETMEHAIKTQLDKGLDKVDTHEMYEAVDIYKDLSEVKKNIIEGCYKMQIMEAMEEAEYGEDYDENGEIRYYRGQPRSKTSGRYMSRGDGRRNYMYPEEYYRDMDRESMRRMYTSNMNNSAGDTRSYSDGYSDGERKGYNDGETAGYQRGYSDGNRSSSNNRYERARRNYEETKANKTGNQAEDSQKEMRSLEQMLNAFESELTEMLPKMSQNEKNLAKNKVASWQNKVQ